MSHAASTGWQEANGGGRTWLVALILLVGTILIVAATVLGNGNPLIAVAPILGLAIAGLVWHLPLRFPLFVVIFLGLGIDSKSEGPWDTPLAPLGSLLHLNLAKSMPGNIPLSGVMLVLLGLLVLHIHRAISGSTIDLASRAPAAKTLIRGLAISALAILGLCALGFKSGGDMKMAKIQVQAFLIVLLVGYLCASSFRGIRDYRILGWIVIASACIKSIIAIYVVKVIVPFQEFATAHGDSLLFAGAAVLLIVNFAERPSTGSFLLGATTLPLIMGGMVANDRRLVWVQILLALVAFWLISRKSRFKVFVVRCFICALPLVLAYVVVGWNSQSEIFAPVKTLRSVGDSNVDPSTMYRDLENYNLLATVRVNPFLGTGFGHPFAEEVKLPDISFFAEYRYMPHNSMLGLWAFCGPLGFTGLTMALTIALYLAARSYRCAKTAEERIAAFMVIGMMIIYLVHCWGDIGFSERRTYVLVGPMLAIAGQLALSTGAWRVRSQASGRSLVRQ